MANKKKFFHFRFLFFPFLAFLFGIVMARKLFAANVLAIIVVATIFIVMTVLFLCCKRWKGLLIVFVFFLIGNGFYLIGLLQMTNKPYEGENFVIGRVTDEVTERYDNYTLTLVDVFINGESAKNIYLNIKTDNNIEFKSGDVLTFTSSVESVELFDDGSFNSFYFRNDIGYTANIVAKDVQVIDSKLSFDETLRLSVKELLENNMSSENAGICYAVLFGDKSGISYETKEYYQNAGIIHILTISGLHVGFLIALIYFVLRKMKLGRISTTIITSIILLLFNILCGFAPSVMRASLMAIIMMLSKLSGREYDNLNSLGLAGFIILLIKPFYAFDVGFLMSFSCVACIFMLHKPISNFLRRVMPNKLAEYLALSISAQLGILPFIATFTSSVNLLSFFVNLIIVPLFSIVYPALMFVMLLLCIIPQFGQMLVAFDFVFGINTVVAKFFASSSFQLPLVPFDIVFMIFYFLLMFLLSQYTMMPKVKKFFTASVMTLLLVVSTIINLVGV